MAGPETTLREAIRYDIPSYALREFLMNAIMHRTYEANAPIRFYWFDDRVEIQSPGGLFSLSRPENFPEQNDYRNPVIAEAMKNPGYINRFGGGVRRAQAALAANGNRPAEFKLDPSFVKVTIWTVS